MSGAKGFGGMSPDGPKIGESSLEEGIRLRPFTALAVIAFAFVTVAGIVFVVFYPDNAAERMVWVLVSAALDLGIGLLALTVIQREERQPYPLLARRALWWMALGLYAIAVLVVLNLIRSPVLPADRSIWFVAKLVTLLPAPLIAWHLLRTEKRS